MPILHVDVWGSKVPGYQALNTRLLQEIRAHQAEQTAQMQYNNPGCWRGSKRYACEEELLGVIRAQIGFITKRYKPDFSLEDFDLAIDYWTNVNSRGGSNEMHTHSISGSDWSGCYYIQATGTGAVRFYTEQCLHRHIKPYLPFGTTCEIHPHDGDLLLFPSYLLHAVMPNPIERERINIAFDVRIAQKQRS
jgi:uncharacterized protein (TIGR02466 family)